MKIQIQSELRHLKDFAHGKKQAVLNNSHVADLEQSNYL